MQITHYTIMGGATVALIIPFLGNTFVDGWNWTWHDFLFAWVFFVAMGTSVFILSRRFGQYQWLVGTIFFFLFAAVWGILATG